MTFATCVVLTPIDDIEKIMYYYVLNNLLVRLVCGRAMIVCKIGTAGITNKVSYKFV